MISGVIDIGGSFLSLESGNNFSNLRMRIGATICGSSIGLDGVVYDFSWVLSGDTFEFTYLQTEGNANITNAALGSCIDSMAPSS